MLRLVRFSFIKGNVAQHRLGECKPNNLGGKQLSAKAESFYLS